MCQEITSDTIEEVNDFLIHGIAGKLLRQENNAYSNCNIPGKIQDPSIQTVEHMYTLPELQQYFSILNSIRSEDEIL